MTVKKIEKINLPAPRAKKKVAAYARVSMASEQLEHSLEAQISYYNDLIRKNPEWEFAGIYSDNGITGTSTSKRKGFQQMIADAEAGKIDIILTKSISRFARNTVDLLSTVRHLKALGIEVRFDREHINTLSADGEVMLTILASFAEAESKSISQNVKWGTRKRFELGIPNGGKRLLGYSWDGEQYQIIPEEAETVKKIFADYLSGQSIYEIQKKGYIGINHTPMSPSGIMSVLDNEKYTGDMILQKRYKASSNETKANQGELPRYEVREAHEGIISREDYERVQQMRGSRREEIISRRDAPTIFSGKVFCGRCGRPCDRRTRTDGKVWVCRTKTHRGNKTCSCLPVKESELITAMSDLGISDFERVILFDERIEFYTNGTSDHLALGNSHSSEKFSTSDNSQKHTPKRNHIIIWKKLDQPNPFRSKIFCGKCGGKCERVRSKGKDKNRFYWACKTKGCTCRTVYEDELQEAVDTFFPGERFRYDVEKVLLYNDRFEFVVGSSAAEDPAAEALVAEDPVAEAPAGGSPAVGEATPVVEDTYKAATPVEGEATPAVRPSAEGEATPAAEEPSKAATAQAGMSMSVLPATEGNHAADTHAEAEGGIRIWQRQ